MNSKFLKSVLVAATLSLVASSAFVPAQAAMMANSMKMAGTKMVGGAAMYPTKNIIENAINSKDHTTLVAAVKAAGLVATLETKGPFTVFAPTNEAFAALPAGTVDTLLKPENKAKLATILTDHVLAGHYDAADLAAKAKAAGGSVAIKSVGGAVGSSGAPSQTIVRLPCFLTMACIRLTKTLNTSSADFSWCLAINAMTSGIVSMPAGEASSQPIWMNGDV